MPPRQETSPASRWITHHRLTYFRAGYTKHQALPNNGQSVVEFPYVQINPADNINFLVVDVDRCDALMLLMHPAVPPATWIIHKPESGHAQAGWAIDPVFVGRGHRPGPKQYADSVLRSLTRLVYGDENFTRFLVQNPSARNPVGKVYWGNRATPWHLGELMDHMKSYVDPFHDEILDGPAVSAWQPTPDRAKQSRVVQQAIANTSGRNCSLFRKTLRWLWTRWLGEEREPHEPDALAYARTLNRDLEHPLPDKEVRALSASACRQARKGNGRPRTSSHGGKRNQFLSRKGRVGGKATSEAKAEAAAANAATGRTVRSAMTDAKALKAQALHLAGESKQAIAELMRASVKTVGRWLARAVEGAETITPPVASRMSRQEQPGALPSDQSESAEWGHSASIPADTGAVPDPESAETPAEPTLRMDEGAIYRSPEVLPPIRPSEPRVWATLQRAIGRPPRARPH